MLSFVACSGGSSSGTISSIPIPVGTTTPPPPPPPPPVEEIQVSLTGVGAFYSDVVVTITGPWDGSYKADIGRVKLTTTGLTIRSDGRLGRGTLTIDGKDYYYDIVEDDVCTHTYDPYSSYKIDCFGYETGGRSASMIWYDTNEVVTIEIGFVRSNTLYPDFEDGDRVPDDHEVRMLVEQDVAKWNKMLARNKIYIRYEITDIYFADAWYNFFDFPGHPLLNQYSDIVYGWGGSGSNGGQAYMSPSIYSSMKTPRAVGLNLGGTMWHEVGHAMSLGHGIWGEPYWSLETATDQDLRYSIGAIFPRFGHGWDSRITSEGVCGVQGSVMSYGSRSLYTNSLNSCSDLGYGPGAWGDAAGSRLQSDEAYALNRIRFSFSLIHNEFLHGRDTYQPTGSTTPVVHQDCPRQGTPQTGLTDCMGHAVSTNYPEEGYIYFGDNDTTVVNWEVVLLVFDRNCANYVDGSLEPAVCGPADKQSPQYLQHTEVIGKINEVLERSGVHVQLDLIDIRYAYFTGFADHSWTDEDYKVDAVLQLGGPISNSNGGVVCGWGGFNANLDRPLRPWGICSWKSLLHELGHTVGLGHGPYNSRNEDTGYIFPQFGHGSGGVCPGHNSMMAYDVTQSLFSNSLLTCEQITPNGVGGDKQAGYRGLTPNGDYGYDEAYSINRVRYNVAGINGETIIRD